MCGVFAFLGADPLRGKDSLAIKMMKDLQHRGIRSSIVQRGCGVMGHTRLPIVGTKTSNDQPYQDSRFSLGFVGEVLDFREYYPDMECDVDLVVKRMLFDEDRAGLEGHDGFWGIVILDDAAQTLTVVTDYLGIKPMYYREDFPSAASEIQPLVRMGKVTFDEVYFAAVAKWGYCPDTTRTPWNEVKHLLPGERIILKKGARPDRCISDPLRPQFLDRDELKFAIEEAVRLRVKSSDVPVAMLLSGGLDSSIVYTLAKEHGDVRPYYAGTDAHALESEAVHLLTGGKFTPIDWQKITELEGVLTMQEPIDLGSLRPQIALAEGVEETVCLTGDGADELFGGYGRAQRYDSQQSDIYQELHAWHLPRLDRVMMRERVEVRSPFLARSVVEGALGLPYAKRIGKAILRDAFRDAVPGGLVDMPKIPLRTSSVAFDREANSIQLIKLFKEHALEDALNG